MSIELSANDAKAPYVTNYGPGGVQNWHLGMGTAEPMAGETYLWLPWHRLKPLFEKYPNHDVVLTKAIFNWINNTSGAAPGKLIDMAIWVGHDDGGQRLINLDSQSSGTITTKLAWEGHVSLNNYGTSPYFAADPHHVTFHVINTLADMVTTLDAWSYYLEGLLYPRLEPQDNPPVQSVSLEGYKWPLVRR